MREALKIHCLKEGNFRGASLAITLMCQLGCASTAFMGFKTTFQILFKAVADWVLRLDLP